MPFTFSHPAYILPLARRGLVLSALVVGSMAPDFPYFAMLNAGWQFGHTLMGIVAFDLPATLALLALYHHLLKAPLVELAPAELRRCLRAASPRFEWGPAGRFGWICASIIIGALSHNVIDSFTHPYGWMVVRQSWLWTPVIMGPTAAIPLFALLQHVTSLVGAVILVAGVSNWLRRNAPAGHRIGLAPAAWAMAGVALVIGILLSIALQLSSFGVVTGFAGALLVILTGYGGWWRTQVPNRGGGNE